MAEATLIKQLDTFLGSGVDVVTLTASDGETWRSRRLAGVDAALISLNADSDADTNVTFSGNTCTMNMVGITDKKVTLLMFGTA